MGCLHKRCIIADVHKMHIRCHLFTIGNLADRCVDSLYIPLDALTGKYGNNLPNTVRRAFLDTLDIRLSDFPTVIVVCLIYEFSQNHCPYIIDRQNICAVNNGYAGIQNIFFRFRGDQVDADCTRSVRIQGGVQDFAEGRVHISLQITDCLRFSEKQRYLGHSVLSALGFGLSYKCRADWKCFSISFCHNRDRCRRRQ